MYHINFFQLLTYRLSRFKRAHPRLNTSCFPNASLLTLLRIRRLIFLQQLRMSLNYILALIDIVERYFELGVLRALIVGKSVKAFDKLQGFTFN
jgi:hypothetical protein